MKRNQTKRKVEKHNEKNGITLIALVITIIVLLILAGISITMLTGDNSILRRATEASEKTEMAQIKEKADLAIIGKNMGTFSGSTSMPNAMLLREDAIEEVNAEFTGSTRNGDRITTADGKYDIIVKTDLSTIVVKHGEKYIAPGEIEITYFVSPSKAPTGKCIMLYFDMGDNNQTNGKKTYWQFVKEFLAGKTEEQMEQILMESTGTKTVEEFYRNHLGSQNKEEAEEWIMNQLGMGYKDGLEVLLTMSIGGINIPMEEYIMYILDAQNTSIEDLPDLVDRDTYDELLNQILESQNAENISQLSEKIGMSEENIIKMLVAMAYVEGNNGGVLRNSSITLTTPDGQQGPISDFMMYMYYMVEENGEYTFSATGPNGEKGKVTINVTGIGEVSNP